MRQIQNQDLLTRIVAALITIGITALAVFLGAFLIAALVGLAAIATVVLAVRVWWLRRKMERSARRGGAGRTLEGEFTVHRDERK